MQWYQNIFGMAAWFFDSPLPLFLKQSNDDKFDQFCIVPYAYELALDLGQKGE